MAKKNNRKGTLILLSDGVLSSQTPERIKTSLALFVKTSKLPRDWAVDESKGCLAFHLIDEPGNIFGDPKKEGYQEYTDYFSYRIGNA